MNELVTANHFAWRFIFKDKNYVDVPKQYGDDIITNKNAGAFYKVITGCKNRNGSYYLIEDIEHIINLDEKREEDAKKQELQDKRFEFVNKFTGSNEYDHNAVEVLRFQAKCGGRFDDMIYKANDEMKVKIKKYLEDTIDSMKKAPYADQHNQEYATIKDNEIIKDYKYFLTLLES